MVRDPVTWLIAVFRLRLQRRDPLAIIESARKVGVEEPAQAIQAAKAQEP
jgi:hypothetical protein